MKPSILAALLCLSIGLLPDAAPAQTAEPAQTTPAQTAVPAQTAANIPPHINAAAEMQHLIDVDATALKKHDNLSRLKVALQFRILLNNSGAAILHAAHAWDTLKDTVKVIESLTEYARLGFGNKAICNGDDTKFAGMQSNPGFDNICRLINENSTPVDKATPVLQIPDTGYLVEDIAFDEQDQSFLFTSVLKHGIFRLTPDGACRPFVTSPSGWPMMAIKIDHSKQLLWATEVAMPGFDGQPDSIKGRSALLCIDLRSAAIKNRYPAPDGAQWGDMVLDAQGNPIVSDGRSGTIFHLKQEKWQQIDKGDFIAPQTAALATDGKQLIVPDYNRGLALLDIATGAVTWLNFDPSHPCALNGVDGVYFKGNRLFLTQNGIDPERVIELTLDKTLKHVIGLSIIERATKELGEPTHGVIAGNNFYFIANSGWDALDPHGKPKPGARMTQPTIMRYPL